MDQPKFDPTQIQVLPLAQRRSYIAIDQAAIDPEAPAPEAGPLAETIDHLASSLQAARSRGAARMLVYGAHLVKMGVSPLINALIRSGWITHAATQGAGIIHDWEFAHLGRSSESVRDNAPVGRFGTWDETGRWLNLAAAAGAAEGLGLGASVGQLIATQGLTLPDPNALHQAIAESPDAPLAGARADLLSLMKRLELRGGRHDLPHPWHTYSIPATAHQSDVRFTVHPGIGYDILNCHPAFCPGAIGRGSGTDFHQFCDSVMQLTGGVYLSVGSAIMSPQVFEKAFSLANNLRAQCGKPFIQDHHMAVVDLQDGGGWDWSRDGEPPLNHPAYYLRWCKSFHRMGGRLDYLQADLTCVLANLWHRLKNA